MRIHAPDEADRGARRRSPRDVVVVVVVVVVDLQARIAVVAEEGDGGIALDCDR
jgi:hypothetical protein